MDGYTPSLDVVTRIYNLIEQIPAEYRKAAESDCFSTGMSDHEYERNLTGYVMRKAWITAEQRKQAEEVKADNNWLEDSMFVKLDAIGAEREGTEPSPIISGGEVLYITHPTGNDDIPF